MLGAVSFSSRQSDFDWISEVFRTCGLSVRTLRGSGSPFVASSPPEGDVHFLAGEISLTWRGDLLAQLGLSSNTADLLSDIELTVLAYRKWGDRCAEHLEGDYGFALWDDRARRVFCCVDHLGSIPLLYWRSPDRLILGGSSAAILTMPGVPRRLNRKKLQGLCVYGGQHFREEETFHEGILSLPAGCCMVADAGQIRQWRYWEAGIRPDIVPADPVDAFAALRELLSSAVEHRMSRSKQPGVLLSGGLDSSAVAAIAARSLEKANRALVAISTVLSPENREKFGDEREYVEEFRAFSNVRIEYVTAPEKGPFEFIDNPEYFADALMRTSRSFLFDAIGQVAQASEVDLLFTGNMGEIGATCYATGYYMELLARMRVLTLRRELARASALSGTSGLRILARDFARLTDLGSRFIPSILFTPDFMRQCETPALHFSHAPDHRTRQLSLLRHYLRKHALRTDTRLEGIPMRTPLCDKRVIEFCLAAEGGLKVRDGYNRYLIRGALDGLLPPKIQWRTSKTPASPDYAARYDAQLWKAKLFVANIGTGDPVRTIVDVDRLTNLLVPSGELDSFRTALISIPATIRLICFLRQFPEFQP